MLADILCHCRLMVWWGGAACDSGTDDTTPPDSYPPLSDEHSEMCLRNLLQGALRVSYLGDCALCSARKDTHSTKRIA
jgi:hypothetical protein